jgi:hypothetical protein
VTFCGGGSNLDPGDPLWYLDIYVRDRSGRTPFRSLCDPGVGGVSACPCSNPSSGPDRGCDNSFGTGGAALSALGGAILSSDTLVFAANGEGPSSTSCVLQGTRSISGGAVYGQGVRCAGGQLTRLYSKFAVGGSVRAPDFDAHDLQVSARSAALGDVILAGQSRWYLVYYRDTNSTLCPPPHGGSFNSTQTGEIVWAP